MLRAVDTVAKTDTGRQRRDNEDSMLARAPVFVVADGMGGARAGEVASQIAIEVFEHGLPDSGSPEERLANCVQEANQRIHQRSAAERERAGMGTTITAAYLDDAQLAIAHVGDSRAYLFREESLTRLTEDHSLVEELVRHGKLTAEQAAEHPQRSIITRALGPEPTVEVDTWTYPVQAGDVLLLCSDGLTAMISEERVAEILSTAKSLDEAAQHLIDEANEAGGRDNITVVLFRLEEVGTHGRADGPTSVDPSARRVTTPGREQADAASTPIARVPLARTQGRPAPRSTEPPRRRRYRRLLAAGVAAVIVLLLIGGGGWLASRQLYFIGTNAQGIVTIYRGLPYNLPAGIRLYETFYVSGVPVAAVPADRRSQLLNNHLRSQADASSLVRDLELGRISK